MENLLRISKADNLPLKKATFYKWHHIGKFPEIFVKVSGALFVDLDRLEQLIDASRGHKRAAMGRKGGGEAKSDPVGRNKGGKAGRIDPEARREV